MGITGPCFRPDGSRDATGAAISVSKSGAVWSDTVDGSAAWRVVEGTTNLILNPLFVPTGSAPWGGDQGSRVHNGDGSCFVTGLDGISGSAVVWSNIINRIALTAGETYTLSMWVKPPVTSNWRVTTSCRNASNTDVGFLTGSYTSVGPSGGWVTFTFIAPANTVSAWVSCTPATNHGCSSAEVWYPQLEAKPYATPFTPAYDSNGVMLAGQAWNGTPNASTSTRTPGSMWIPPSIANGIIDFERGSFYLRAKDAAIAVPNRRPWRWGGAAAGYDSIMAQTYSDQSFSLNFYAGTTASNAYGGVVVPGGPYTAYGEWDGNNAKVAINGTFGSVGRRSARVGVKPTSDMYIGAGSLTTQQYDGSIAVLMFFPRSLTPAELAKLDATPTALLAYDTLADHPAGILTVGKPGPSILTVGGNPLSLIGGA